MTTKNQDSGPTAVRQIWLSILQCINRNLVVGALLIWGGFGFECLHDATSWPLGNLGDSYGKLNALFSSLAAIAAIQAYWSQRTQLIGQRDEFTSQRHESHLFFLMEELRQAVRGVTFIDRVSQPIVGVQLQKLGGQRAICRLENLLLGKLDSSKAAVPLTRKSPSHGRDVAFITKVQLCKCNKPVFVSVLLAALPTSHGTECPKDKSPYCDTHPKAMLPQKPTRFLDHQYRSAN
jgi:hypothetical protein